jgi:hypothetical protein
MTIGIKADATKLVNAKFAHQGRPPLRGQ